ncbi:hypothetical protein [Streptomyces massasporeus]|uniref:hypothetical protein n=1 Tax=Streptomyces massasporeus TaxID=67324 RepID=UPI0036A32875
MSGRAPTNSFAHLDNSDIWGALAGSADVSAGFRSRTPASRDAARPNRRGTAGTARTEIEIIVEGSETRSSGGGSTGPVGPYGTTGPVITAFGSPGPPRTAVQPTRQGGLLVLSAPEPETT